MAEWRCTAQGEFAKYAPPRPPKALPGWDESAVTQEVMLVEHETFPPQLFGQFNLLEDLLIVDVVGRIEIGIISGQNVDVETHND